MRNDLAFEVWSRERQQRIEGVLEALLPAAGDTPARLAAAMRHAVLGGGKRLRPLLTYAASELVGADAQAADVRAAAVELIHAYSLVHDDLPCMDDDALRRGRPSCHVAFGVATALLAGDALQSLAFGALSRGPGGAEACRILAGAAGPAGMAGGQQLDLDAVADAIDLEALTRLQRMKTGALIDAAIRLGAGCGRSPSVEETRALGAYARAAGLAFQVVDDLLDAEGSSASLGKTAGKDAAQGKATFVTVLGTDEAKRHVQALHAEARAALRPLGRDATRLAELADWIVARRR
ncbi:MAG: polyprenyl synthetase family protein [Proteobacteria bacterium]|nr:polyprenyl synthetase family protein [Pseudomonadota bacterium]